MYSRQKHSKYGRVTSLTVLALQGFGNVGTWAGEVYQEYGAVVTTVCDSTTAVHNPEGLDIKALRKHYEDDSAKLCDFSGGEFSRLQVSFASMPV